jgi:steroid delta-isomerase-like uncharacterized protein
MSDPKADLVRRWFEEVWNKGRESAIDEMCAPDGIIHGLTDNPANPLRGPEAFKPFYRNFHAAFPDIRITVLETICEGDKVAALCRAAGTHKGHTLGFAATQKSMAFEGMVLVRVKNNQIAEGWNFWDFMGLYQRLGALPVI